MLRSSWVKFGGGFGFGALLGSWLWWGVFEPSSQASVVVQSAAASHALVFNYAPPLHPLFVVAIELLAVALACWEADALFDLAE